VNCGTGCKCWKHNCIPKADYVFFVEEEKSKHRRLCSYNGSVFCSLALKGRIVGWGVLWHRLQVLEAQLHP